jgi:hypothetical protein
MYVVGTFCSWDVFFWNVCIWDVLRLGMFCLGMFFCRYTVLEAQARAVEAHIAGWDSHFSCRGSPWSHKD